MKNCLLLTNADEFINTANSCSIVNSFNLFQKHLETAHPELLVIALHGTLDQEKSNTPHYVSLDDRMISTVFILSKLTEPLNLLLLSCFSGTQTMDLAQSLPRGSAIITTSIDSSPSIITVDRYIFDKIFVQIPTQQQFARLFLENIPSLAGSFAKYSVYNDYFLLSPPIEVLISFKQAQNYLKQAQQCFINFCQENHLYHCGKASEIDLVTTAEFLTIYLINLINFNQQELISFLNHTPKHLVTTIVNKNIYGLSALHSAAFGGNPDLVSLLLKYKANPNKLGPGETPPLFIATLYGHLKVVELLINAGAKVNTANEKGYTPLFVALKLGFHQIAQILIIEDAYLFTENDSELVAADLIEGIPELCNFVSAHCLKSKNTEECLDLYWSYPNIRGAIEDEIKSTGEIGHHHESL